MTVQCRCGLYVTYVSTYERAMSVLIRWKLIPVAVSALFNKAGDCSREIKFFLHSAINQIAAVSVFDLILQSSESLKSCCLKHLLLKYSCVFLLLFFFFFPFLHSPLQCHCSQWSWFSVLFSRGKNYGDPDAVWAQPQIVCLSFLLCLIVRKASLCIQFCCFQWMNPVHPSCQEVKKNNKKLKQKKLSKSQTGIFGISSAKCLRISFPWPTAIIS